MTISDDTAAGARRSESSHGFAARAATLWSWILRFLKYGANSDPRKPHYFFRRHSGMVRTTHWINFVVITVMLMSGLQIFNAHPALYLGNTSDFAHPLLSLYAARAADGTMHGIAQLGPWHFDTTGILGLSNVDGQPTIRGFPEWATLPGVQWLAMGRRWHFFFAWLFAINGLAFAAYAFASRHFRRDLLPTAEDLRHLPREIVDHAKLKFAHGEDAKRYNSLQKLAYFIVLFVLGPLVLLTGLTMSPTLDSAFPFLPWIFGGRQTARTIHFACAFSFLGFFIIHIAMVFLSGTWNNLRSMITGNYAIEGDRHE